MVNKLFPGDITPWFHPKTFFFSFSIAIFSYRRRSLQLSGLVAATLIGYLTLANPNPIFGSALLTFFSVGTIATNYKAAIKSSLLDEPENIPVIDNDRKNNNHHHTDHHPGTGRDWKQVLCNSWFGTICAISYLTLLRSHEYTLESNQLLLQKALVSAALAYWAGCAGDTLSSELGILSRSEPRLITNLKTVPPGTNGGVSLLGLIFSSLGGVTVGAVSSWVGEPHQPRTQAMVSCGVFGLLCSMIDSVLGATVQQTVYSKAEKRVLARRTPRLGGARDLALVSGHDWLSNNQVNLLSSTAVGLLAGLLSYHSII